MTLTQFHAQTLNAPVRNPQWSWGSENDKAVFLRVWQHEIRDGKAIVRNIPLKKSAGSTEREKHLGALREGKSGYVIMLKSKDPLAEKNVIESYDHVVYPITDIATGIDGIVWAEIDLSHPVKPSDI